MPDLACELRRVVVERKRDEAEACVADAPVEIEIELPRNSNGSKL
jgi:hypothetical protein